MMSEGIRIRHKTLKNVTLALVDNNEPFTPPYVVCSICHVEHTHKTRHFDLDGEGTVIVSQGVLDALQHHVDLGGFDIENPVHNPPAQSVSFNGNGTFTRTIVPSGKMPQDIAVVNKGK